MDKSVIVLNHLTFVLRCDADVQLHLQMVFLLSTGEGVHILYNAGVDEALMQLCIVDMLPTKV